jgi:magnesium transporter
MNLAERIVHGFLREHPREAARVLERAPDGDAREVLSQSKPEEAAAVLAAIVPSAASRHLEQLEPRLAAEVLERLSSDRAADLLRRIEAERRSGILEALDEGPRTPIERLLRFPVNTAGALMHPHFAAYHLSRRVEEAVSELRDRGTDLRYYLYVVDDDLKLVGVLGVKDLMAALPSARLADMMRRPVENLSARAGRNAILRHPGWKRYPSLPVVDELGRLVGVFPYRTFQLLHGSPEEESDPSALGLALALGELFWWGAASLFRGLERMDDGGVNS